MSRDCILHGVAGCVTIFTYPKSTGKPLKVLKQEGNINQVCILRWSPGSTMKNGWRNGRVRHPGRWIMWARDVGILDQSGDDKDGVK